MNHEERSVAKVGVPYQTQNTLTHSPRTPEIYNERAHLSRRGSYRGGTAMRVCGSSFDLLWGCRRAQAQREVQVRAHALVRLIDELRQRFIHRQVRFRLSLLKHHHNHLMRRAFQLGLGRQEPGTHRRAGGSVPEFCSFDSPTGCFWLSFGLGGGVSSSIYFANKYQINIFDHLRARRR